MLILTLKINIVIFSGIEVKLLNCIKQSIPSNFFKETLVFIYR